METKKEQSVDINPILEQNNLTLVKTGFFRDKKTISLVEDETGKRFILKTGRLKTHQIKLMLIAKEIESDLCFKVPAVIKEGAGWILMEEVGGKFLNDYYSDRPDWVVEISRKISDDYQKVLAKFLKGKNVENSLKDGKKWLSGKLCLWSGLIIEEGLIEFQQVKKLQEGFEKAIQKKDEKFFGWSHGDIIGDHIKVSDNGDIYLLDLDIVPRPGKNYYDFLRALDWIFLKAKGEKENSEKIIKWMQQYLPDESWEEVKLVFALRCIGILGWDMLHRGDHGKGDFKEKKKYLLKFIRREY